MSNEPLSFNHPEPSALPTTTSNVLHEPPHWHHHTMTTVISSTPPPQPHPSHHHHHHHNPDTLPISTLSYTIRAGTLADLNAIHKIYTYYVLNSAISLLVQPPNIDYLEKGWHASVSKHLPYLVAVTTRANLTAASALGGSAGSENTAADPAEVSGSNQNTSTEVPENEVEVVLGYAHLVPLSEKAGYGPSAELTMYMHPAYLSFGIGSALMSAIETQLEETPALVFEDGWGNPIVERFVDVILVRMSDDVEKDFEGVRMGECHSSGEEWPVWKAQRERNRLWYLRKGFEEVGRMKRVGEKFGKRIDVIILQKTLSSS